MAFDTGNTLVYKEDWEKFVQKELDEPNKYQDICEVIVSNSRVVHNPYMNDVTVQSPTRGCQYNNNPIVITDDNDTINTFRLAAAFIDRADLAQSGYVSQMYLAERQAVVLKEAIETSLYGDHANATNFGAGDLAGTSTADTAQITVSATNIDDILRQLKKTIVVANGAAVLERFGAFIVWRPADFALLEAFMQANGFSSADKALRDPVYGGVNFMGFTHYTSNLLAANHLLAGVKKQYKLYILKDTWGKIMVDPNDPNNQSGISVVSRADYLPKVWTRVKPVLFDVNVA